MYTDCRKRATPAETAGGVHFLALSDADMLQTQLVLEPTEQKQDRISALRRALQSLD